jgi:hypothetical protein
MLINETDLIDPLSPDYSEDKERRKEQLKKLKSS